MEELSFEKRLRHKRQRALFDYWRKRASGKSLPSAKAIEPGSFQELFEETALVSVEREAARLHFRFNFAGQKLILRLGQDPYGRRLRDVFSESEGAALRIAMVELTALKRPQLLQHSTDLIGFEERYYEDLLLPCVGGGGMVELIILQQLVSENDAPWETDYDKTVGGLFKF